MHVVPKAPRACILLRTGRAPIEYPSREAAFAALRPIILYGRLGSAFAPAVYRTNWFGTSQIREAVDHILLDVLTWRPLRVEDFAKWLPVRTPWHIRRYAGWNGTGPVPDTGRRRYHGRPYRPMRTQRSRRMACLADPEDVLPRPRAGKGLPSLWDDRVRSDRREKSWKRHRRTQWRVQQHPMLLPVYQMRNKLVDDLLSLD